MFFVAVIKLTSFTKYNSLINNYKNYMTPNPYAYYHVISKE